MSPSSLPRRAIFALAAVAVLIMSSLTILLVRSRKASQQASNDMAVVFRAQAAIIAQADKREHQRDAVLSKNLEQISRAKLSTKTSADVIKRLPAAFSPLPEPVSVSIAPLSSGPDVSEAPAVITVPQADLQPLFDHLADCHACQERLATAQQDLNDERAKVSALMTERDAAAKAARGGGFWSRLRSNAKWFGIGGAMGALAASAAHH
jgi:hypothetical protein